MLGYVSSIIATLLLEAERVVPGQEKYNMATFMVLFLLITIEVVVVKVVTSDMERDEESHAGLRAAATFFDREDWSSIIVDHRVTLLCRNIVQQVEQMKTISWDKNLAVQRDLWVMRFFDQIYSVPWSNSLVILACFLCY